MRSVALASGSNGNAIWVETRDARLLFDAGISGKKLQERSATRDVDPFDVDALLLSHNHSDHTCGAGVAHRRFGVPIHATRGTWRVISKRMGRVEGPRIFTGGETLRFGGTRVLTIPTPHDGVDGCAFVVEENGARLGILTDLGHAFDELGRVLGTLDAAYLEANYDPEMLETGPYPLDLQKRIRGPGGHLSNPEAVELALDAGRRRLTQVVLCHLSGENNAPEAVLDSARPLEGRGVRVRIAGRHTASDWLDL